MKYFTFFILIFSYFLYASETLTIKQKQSLVIYNHKPSTQINLKAKMRKMAKISSDKAKEIASSICQEEIGVPLLTHQKSFLFYRFSSTHCDIRVNALDGTLL